MKILFILLSCFLFISCKEEIPDTNIITENLQFFSLYDATCESWIEKKYACNSENCFSSSAVEIVGIDTSNIDSVKVYAWAWSEQFVERNQQSYSGAKKLLITKFVIDASTRKKQILDVFIPNEDLPIDEQLESQEFPENIIEQYFTKQPESVERIRIQALTQKAKDKFLLYQKSIYIPDTSIVINTDSVELEQDSVL